MRKGEFGVRLCANSKVVCENATRSAVSEILKLAGLLPTSVAISPLFMKAYHA